MSDKYANMPIDKAFYFCENQISLHTFLYR